MSEQQRKLRGQAAEIDGKTYLNDFEGPAPEPGALGRVRITKSYDYDLIGTLLTGFERAPAPPLLQVLS